eukprot:2206107-Alexandrium_andersonii.AAC.1
MNHPRHRQARCNARGGCCSAAQWAHALSRSARAVSGAVSARSRRLCSSVSALGSRATFASRP